MINPKDFYPEDLDIESLIIERYKKDGNIYERHSGILNTELGPVEWSLNMFIMNENDESIEEKITRFENELKILENKEKYEEAKDLAEKIKKLKKKE